MFLKKLAFNFLLINLIVRFVIKIHISIFKKVISLKLVYHNLNTQFKKAKMKKILLYLLITTGKLSGGCINTDNKLTNQEIGEGGQLLFDGESLRGWRDYHGEDVAAS